MFNVHTINNICIQTIDRPNLFCHLALSRLFSICHSQLFPFLLHFHLKSSWEMFNKNDITKIETCAQVHWELKKDLWWPNSRISSWTWLETIFYLFLIGPNPALKYSIIAIFKNLIWAKFLRFHFKLELLCLVCTWKHFFLFFFISCRWFKMVWKTFY